MKTELKDIYGSDGNGRREPKNEKDFYYDPYYEYTESGNTGELTGSLADNADDGKFHVNIPAEKLGYGAARNERNRTPVGRPADVYSAANTSQSANNYAAGQENIKNNSTYSSDRRAPKGAPLYGQSSSYNSSVGAQRQQPSAYSSNVHSQTQPNVKTMPKKRKAYTPSGENDIKSSSSKKNKPKKKGTAKKVFASVVCVILALVIALGSVIYSMLGKISYDDTALEKNQYIKESELATNKKVQNILFLGSDYRDGEVQGMRSDTMILFSIDKINKQLKLTSFLRDSYVYLPSKDSWRKLNASCALGGPQLVKDTLEYNFKVKIDNYVLVDFEAFTTFIDKIGGLDISGVTQEEADYLRNTVKVPHVKKGKNHFTGGAALWYCRIRYLDDDFHRTQRQRKVISAIITQVKKTNPKKLYDAVSAVMPMIKTDIAKNDLVTLGAGMLAIYSRYDIKQFRVPKDGTWNYEDVYIDGSVVRLDIEKNAQLLKKFLYPSKKK